MSVAARSHSPSRLPSRFDIINRSHRIFDFIGQITLITRHLRILTHSLDAGFFLFCILWWVETHSNMVCFGQYFASFLLISCPCMIGKRFYGPEMKHRHNQSPRTSGRIGNSGHRSRKWPKLYRFPWFWPHFAFFMPRFWVYSTDRCFQVPGARADTPIYLWNKVRWFIATFLCNFTFDYRGFLTFLW